jgi:membrane peptidoglycan carboxypeptidase
MAKYQFGKVNKTIKKSKKQAPAKSTNLGNFKKTKKPKQKKSIPKRILMCFGILIFLLLVLVSASSIYIYASTQTPGVGDFGVPQTTNVYYSDGKTLLGSFASENREIIDISTIPTYVGNAVVASEDHTFWNNSGVDIPSILRAMFNNLLGKPQQGASTITQQYVKNYILQRQTTNYLGKFREAVMALKINNTMSKQDILDNYMNTIFFGRGAYGIETAAKAYFNKPASKLTIPEAALIAGVMPAPSAYDPSVNPKLAHERWNYVMDNMADFGFITHQQRQTLKFPKVSKVKVEQMYSGTKGYLLQSVKDEIINNTRLNDADLLVGGYKIVSTIKTKNQASCVQAMNNVPKGAPSGFKDAMVSIDSSNGEVIAMYGGKNYLKVQQNAATQDIVQAGSTFKAFTLAAAAEQNISFYQSFSGRSPITINNWHIENEFNQSFGNMNILQATAKSVNVVFAQLNKEIGAENTYYAALNAGIPKDTSGLTEYLSNVLGTASPHPIDMVNAYATFANGGIRHTPHVIKQIYDSNDNQIYQGPTTGVRAFDKEVADKVTYALRQVVQCGTGAKAGALGRPVAGKTGTSEEHQSAWFIGYTPQISTGVAFYRNSPKGDVLPLPGWGGYSVVNGADMPTQAWLTYMIAAHKNLPVENFDQPTSIGGKYLPGYGITTSTDSSSKKSTKDKTDAKKKSNSKSKKSSSSANKNTKSDKSKSDTKKSDSSNDTKNKKSTD